MGQGRGEAEKHLNLGSSGASFHANTQVSRQATWVLIRSARDRVNGDASSFSSLESQPHYGRGQDGRAGKDVFRL